MNLLKADELVVVIKIPHHRVVVDRLRPRRLPYKVRRNCVGVAVDGIGQGKRTAESAIVVVAKPRPGGDDQSQRSRTQAK